MKSHKSTKSKAKSYSHLRLGPTIDSGTPTINNLVKTLNMKFLQLITSANPIMPSELQSAFISLNTNHLFSVASALNVLSQSLIGLKGSSRRSSDRCSKRLGDMTPTSSYSPSETQEVLWTIASCLEDCNIDLAGRI